MPIGIIVVVIIIIAVFAYVKTRPTPPQAVVLPAGSSPTGTAAVVVPVTPTGSQPNPTTITPTVVVPITPATALPGPYLWNPLTTSTQDLTLALSYPSANGEKVYIAAAKNSSGQLVLGKSNGIYIWYPDNNLEKYIPVAQGYLLPASAVPTASWSGVLSRGVALSNAPTTYVCRAGMGNNIINNGSSGAGVCYVPWGGQLLAKTPFEYLNI